MDSLQILSANQDTLDAWDAMAPSEPSVPAAEPAAETTPAAPAEAAPAAEEIPSEETGESVADDGETVYDEVEEEPAEQQPAALDLAAVAAKHELEKAYSLLQQQQEQIQHLTATLNAPKALRFDQLDEKTQEKYIKQAEDWGVTDPAALYKADFEAWHNNQVSTRDMAIQQAALYMQQHPDAGHHGAEVAKILASNPAVRAQFAVVDSLPAHQIYDAMRAALDGVFATVKLGHQTASQAAREKHIADQARAKAQQTKHAKKAARTEATSSVAAQTSNTQEDPMEAVFGSRRADFWSNLFR